MQKTKQFESSPDAIPFIVYDQREGFTLSKDAENYLSSLADDRKVGVISIVGKYRTGKSFFVNRVLLDRGKQEKGFQVGPTINPCTKGLWLWRKELKSSEDENMDILLIDTEGFGGMDENVNHDSRIFLFSLLLSSYFIYNSQGSIDENALNSLSLIINLAKDIQINSKSGGMSSADSTGNTSSNGGEDPANYFPSFLWVIRDFALQIVDSMGNKISQKDYLEKALELQKGVSDAIESKNRIRRLMKHFFKERDCNTLVRPVESEKELQNLDAMGNEDLRPEFNEQVIALRRKIFKKVKPKMLCGRTLNGRMLVEICKAYTEAINKGSLPNIENAWTYVKKCETQKAFDSSITLLDQMLFDAQDTAIDPSQLESFKEKMIQETRKILKKNALGDDEDLKEYYKLIDEQASQKFREFKKQNKRQWQKRFSEMCGNEIAELERKLNNEEYNDFWEFEIELSRVKESFLKSLPAKDSNAEKYFSEVSERLYKSAAEKVHKKHDREQFKQLRQAESMLAILERDTQRAKSDAEEQRNSSQRLETQNAQLNATLSVQSASLAQLQESHAKVLSEFNNFKASSQEEHAAKEKEVAKKSKDLEANIDSLKTEFIKKQAAYEKQVALLEQESSFNLRDNKSLHEKISLLESENRKIRQENILHLATIDRLKHQVDDQLERGNRDLDYVRTEFEKKVLEITSETDKKRDIIKQHSEFIIEKTYLENQVSFYKNQLDENKKLHDALLVALQCKQNQTYIHRYTKHTHIHIFTYLNYESQLNSFTFFVDTSSESMTKESEQANANNANNSNAAAANRELTETNRNLGASLEKSEQRNRQLEEKNEKLKDFKLMFNNCSALQCAHCSKFINSNIFLNHLNTCAAAASSIAASAAAAASFSSSAGMAQSLANPQSSAGSMQIQNGFFTQPLDSNPNSNINNQVALITLNPDALHIAINQTMVRESPDNKPYTEYLIQINYSSIQWEVARKYKNFCELQQQLMQLFPTMKFPESSAAIINSSTDINNIFSTKRPTVIEDRRKALQQYLRDLARIDVVRNTKPYKLFLEVEKLIEIQRQQQQAQPRSNQMLASAPNTGNMRAYASSSSSNVPTFQANLADLKGGIGMDQSMQYQQNPNALAYMKQQQMQQQQQQQQLYQQHQQQQYYQDQNSNQAATEAKKQSNAAAAAALTMSPETFLKAWNEKQQSQTQLNSNNYLKQYQSSSSSSSHSASQY